MKSQISPIRVRIFFFLFVFFSLVLILKLYIVQIVSGEEYSTRADRQYLRPSDSVLERGTIFFTRKDGGLITTAHQETGYIVAVNPPALLDAGAAYASINEILPIDEKAFLSKARKTDDPYEEIAKKVPLAIGERLLELKIPGVIIHKQKWRFYPNEDLAAHTLGFMAFKDDEYAGRYGLEKFYDEALKRDNASLYANFFVEIFSNLQESFSDDDKARGDIVTSIEPTVQAYLEQEIEKVNKKWSSDFSGGIVIDPKTGEIIAMGIYPNFNPNSFQEEKNASVYLNRLVENVYEMGSIIKPLTMAAGLDSGAVTAHTTYFDAGTLWLNNKQISNFDGKARGLVDMQQVLSQSLNTGVATVALKMGNKKFTEYMKAFGLAEKSGIDLPYEAAPLVSNLDTPRDLEHANASFGQGIALTPMSTVRALSALANGGTLINPHIVKKINYRSGLSKTIDFEPGRQVIKKETSEEISRMLVRVVDEALLGGTVKQEHYSIAAKTGTAQIARAGGYYDDRFFHSFFGYFPAYDSKFLVFLFTSYPKEVKYASETLTHSFIDITKYLINYYEISPDR